ncbi:MAG: type VI secretion system lipoprotein TssJ [Methylococcaceae bacterium]|nr:type VI secretion system lipoprotein TssJ [Methylococcaceae bacterium]
MKYISFSFMRLICISAFLFLSGCGVFGSTPEPITMELKPIIMDLTITASKELNPDIENRASPIVIRIYQLTHIDSFNNSDFFALYENDKSILAKDLKYREEMEIKPGLTTSKPLEINPDSKYIAVLAAFRDLDKAQWKSILEIDPLNIQPLKLDLGEFDVTLGVED